jgi:sec-independent protein translocase protein TatA
MQPNRTPASAATAAARVGVQLPRVGRPRVFGPQERFLMRFGSIGLPELILIVLILMIVFGANRLPDIGRGIGKAIKNFKEAGKEE